MAADKPAKVRVLVGPRPSARDGPPQKRARLAAPTGAEKIELNLVVSKTAIEDILKQRLEDLSLVYRTLDVLKRDMRDFFPKVPAVLPTILDGRILNPNANPAAQVSVRALKPANPPGGLNRPWPLPETITDARGCFRLSLPAFPVPEVGLDLLITGSNGSAKLTIKRSDLVASSGSLGVLPLEKPLTPLEKSVVAQLAEVAVPTSEEDVVNQPGAFADPVPSVMLGEGDCARSFRSNAGVIDRHAFSFLVRLTSPQLSGRQVALKVKGNPGKFWHKPLNTSLLAPYLPANSVLDAMTEMGSWELVDRIPIARPIDVTGFRDGIERSPNVVPKASSLCIGYLVKMHQTWIPQGLSLGDLIYSLPLAPGEQQRIAVSEQQESLSVREFEALTAEEAQRYREQADSSTTAVFQSAFDESASGGSRTKVSTEAGSFGGGLGAGGTLGFVTAGIGISGGYSDSTTTGQSSSWQKASRDYVSSATEDFHSELGRQASARRSANRVSIRLATASERQEVVCKVISNHNHNHALTMQYWQVLRHYAVSTKVDDVQLVCYVPLEVVQFLPWGEPRTLPAGTYTRDELLTRYEMLLRYFDVLQKRFARRTDLLHGMRLLRGFAGDPTMDVQGATEAAQDIIDVSLKGTFLPFEDIYVMAVANSGARVGPIRLAGTSAPVANDLETQAALLEALRHRRGNLIFKETRKGSLVLPSELARSDLARLEFSRSFRTFSYRVSLPEGFNGTDILSYLSSSKELDVTLSPADLEREIGGPLVENPTAQIQDGPLDLIEVYSGDDGSDRMGTVWPIATKRLASILRFTDLLRIEAVLLHVVQNTVAYSKAVWQSLTAEERAILLEPFTIGVPDGGIADASSEVPLLNCVANQVITYFGNCAVMPFFIPASLAGEMKVTSRDVQEALLKFHRQAFVPPQSSITLPTRGVLGEAVLGACSSSEKIDLTRFWNWQDSPGDIATDPAQMAGLFGRGNALIGPAGATAPSQLTTGPMVTINQGPAAMSPSDLARALIEKLPSSNLPQNLTGLAELAAQSKVQTESTISSLNNAVTQAAELAKAAMEVLPKTMEAKSKAGKSGNASPGGSAPVGGSGGDSFPTGDAPAPP